jgi:hypothetical protein
MPIIWIVELCDTSRSVARWVPTVCNGLTPCAAIVAMGQWQTRNPHDRLRVKKYQRVREAKHAGRR